MILSIKDLHSNEKEKLSKSTELNVFPMKDSIKRQKMALSLRMIQKSIWKRLKVIDMIQKQRSCIQYKLKIEDVELCFITGKPTIETPKRKHFLHCYVDGKNCFTKVALSAWNHGSITFMHLCRLSNQISTAPRCCSVISCSSLPVYDEC